MDRLIGCGLLESGGGLNPFTSAAACSAIELGLQDRQLTILKDVYRQRKVTLSNALTKHLPAAFHFTEPEGGFFIWLGFPKGIDTQRMLAKARRNNVGYLPGAKFSSRQGLKNYARLSFSYFDNPDLEEGVRRLARVIKEYVNDE